MRYSICHCKSCFKKKVSEGSNHWAGINQILLSSMGLTLGVMSPTPNSRPSKYCTHSPPTRSCF